MDVANTHPHIHTHAHTPNRGERQQLSGIANIDSNTLSFFYFPFLKAQS